MTIVSGQWYIVVQCVFFYTKTDYSLSVYVFLQVVKVRQSFNFQHHQHKEKDICSPPLRQLCFVLGSFFWTHESIHVHIKLQLHPPQQTTEPICCNPVCLYPIFFFDQQFVDKKIPAVVPLRYPLPKNIANWTFTFTVIHVSSITTHPAHTHHATELYYYTNLKK